MNISALRTKRRLEDKQRGNTKWLRMTFQFFWSCSLCLGGCVRGLKANTDVLNEDETDLSGFPFDFGGFGDGISALVYVKLFGEGFVLKVWILVKILRETEHHIVTRLSQTSVHSEHRNTVKQKTHKIYSISRLDILKLGDLHPRQVMKRLLVLLPQKSWNYRADNTRSLHMYSSIQETYTTDDRVHVRSPCGWLTNVVTQKLGILAMSSDLFWKNGWRNLLYFCSTFKISSLACSFSLEGRR